MHRILVVDDERSFRAVVRMALERAGYVVEEAEDARQAVNAFVRDRFDLVLVDLMLARGSGEIVGLLRDLDEDLTIIAVSEPSKTGLEDALEMGANLYLKKPFSVEALLAVVRLLLE